MPIEADSTDSTMTRADWFAAADRMLDALAPFRAESGALIALPGKPSWSGARSDAFEGYARSFLLLALRVAGDGADPGSLLPRYRDGLLAGTDPGHPDAWPVIVDRGQALVEAASLVIALDLTRMWLWDRLSAAERGRVARWLHPSAQVQTPDNNWVLFRVMVQEFLAGSGFPFEPSVIDDGLSRVDHWYDGDGWFRDGDGQRFDYYNAWALHLYPLLWARMHDRRDPVRAGRHRERALERLAAFLPHHVRFFGADGTPVFQGRSLAYRFAALAPLWLGELYGVSPLEPGALRVLASRTFRRFARGGAFDDRGVLTGGWFGAFPPMIQPYSGPASPYWASKAFLGLLLPADSPVWSAPERLPPVQRSDASLRLRAPGFLLETTAADGIARLVNHGSDYSPPLVGPDDPHYGRFAYSSATAPSFDDHPVDSHIALIDARGRGSRRGAIERLPVGAGAGADGDGLASAHRPYWADPGSNHLEGIPGIRISTASVARGALVVHLHLVERELGAVSAPESVSDTDALELPVRIGGFAIAAETPPQAFLGAQASFVTDGRLVSRITELRADDAAGVPQPVLAPEVHRSASTSPYGSETAIPVLFGRHSGPRTAYLVVTELRGVHAERQEDPELLRFEESDSMLVAEVAFAGGSRRVLRLPLARPSLG